MAEKNLNFKYESAPLKVKIRSVAFPNADLVLELNTTTEVSSVKIAIKEGKSMEA